MRWKAYLCCTFLLIGAFLVACGPPADISTASGRIAFVSTRDEPNPECFHCNIEIYVLNADGSGQTRLTNSPAPDQAPTWSPDGKRIAFESWRDGNFEIYVMNADGSGLTNLTNNPADDRARVWSP